MYTNKYIENFNPPDSITEEIKRIEDAYKNLQKLTTNLSTKTLDTPKGPMSLSNILSTNIINIRVLNTTYNTLLNGPQGGDVKYIRDTMEKSTNEFINRYNNINTSLNLKLPNLDKSSFKTVTTCNQVVQTKLTNTKPATQIAINTAIKDPVLTAIQTVQDAFISLKQDVINSGIKLINTPKGMIPVSGMIDENTKNLNLLAEKYQTMLQENKDTKNIKIYVQKNLNIFIGTFEYIVLTLNLNQPKLQKNMILTEESSKNLDVPIPDKGFNELLSLPIAQLNSVIDRQLSKESLKLQTQMSTHGFDAPPNLSINEPVSLNLPAPKKPLIPKPFKTTHIFDILSATNLSTQSSTI
jgi:hypothetical protein